ncbi:Hypothetical protein POVN_LOCUS187 [uncultured virus]|nr:Hypothetical protein POVN_LOCUS187 [uncultured virus]
MQVINRFLEAASSTAQILKFDALRPLEMRRFSPELSISQNGGAYKVEHMLLIMVQDPAGLLNHMRSNSAKLYSGEVLYFDGKPLDLHPFLTGMLFVGSTCFLVTATPRNVLRLRVKGKAPTLSAIDAPPTEELAMMNIDSGEPVIEVKKLEAKTWHPQAITKFKVDARDFCWEFGKGRMIAAHLQVLHAKRINREFRAFVQSLVTILCTEETLPHERKRFPPEIKVEEKRKGSIYRVGNVLCIRVFDVPKLLSDLKCDLECMQNEHRDKIYIVPVDGIPVRVHAELSCLYRIKDTNILVTAVEPAKPKEKSPLAARASSLIRDGDGDTEMSDPSKAGKKEIVTMAEAMAAVVADAGEHTRRLEKNRILVTTLLMDEGRQKGRMQKLGTPFFEVPIELFWFMTNHFLTARDCSHLSGTCVFSFHAIHSNVKYWKRAFQCLGNIPLYINVNFLEGDVVPIRRWSIIAMLKRRQEQRVHDYNNQVAIACKLPEEADRSARLNSLKAQFLSKRHACPLCFNQVSFQYQLNSSISKKNGFGAVFMACDQCCRHQIWSHTQALMIWGFTEGQLQFLARYTMSGMKFYCTADLLWLRERKYPLYTKAVSEAPLTPGQRARLVDLPPAVALCLRLREQTVDAQGVIWERTLNVGTRAIVVAMRAIVDSDEPYEVLLSYGQPQQPALPLPVEPPTMGLLPAPVHTARPPLPKQGEPDDEEGARGAPPRKKRRVDTSLPSAGPPPPSRALEVMGSGRVLPPVAAPVRQLRLAPVFDRAPTMPHHIGGVGVVPAAAFLAGGTNPTFVAYHGNEPVPVLASSIQYPIAKRSSYVHSIFDPQVVEPDPPQPPQPAALLPPAAPRQPALPLPQEPQQVAPLPQLMGPSQQGPGVHPLPQQGPSPQQP